MQASPPSSISPQPSSIPDESQHPLGDVSEMGDAVLGMVAQELGTQAPAWIAIRNVSDPQIKAEGGMTISQEGDIADKIYKAFGRWSSVCSAIVCWAAVAAL
jgi:hypothetical protein